MTDSRAATDGYSRYWICRNCGAAHEILLRDLPNRTCPQCGMQQNINEEVRSAAKTPPTAPINETVEDRKFMIWALSNRMGRPPTIEEAKDFLAGDFEARKKIWMTKKGN